MKTFITTFVSLMCFSVLSIYSATIVGYAGYDSFLLMDCITLRYIAVCWMLFSILTICISLKLFDIKKLISIFRILLVIMMAIAVVLWSPISSVISALGILLASAWVKHICKNKSYKYMALISCALMAFYLTVCMIIYPWWIGHLNGLKMRVDKAGVIQQHQNITSLLAELPANEQNSVRITYEQWPQSIKKLSPDNVDILYAENSKQRILMATWNWGRLGSSYLIVAKSNEIADIVLPLDTNCLYKIYVGDGIVLYNQEN